MDTWTQIRAAKQGIFNGVDWLIQPENQKLFPYHHFESFRKFTYNGRTQKQRFTPKIHCKFCKEDLSEWGNSEYYTAYILVESETQISACCPQCLPEISLDYNEQIHGFRNEITLPTQFENNLLYNIVFDTIVRQNRFEFNKYIGKKVPEHFVKRVQDSFSGGANGSYIYDYSAKGLRYAKDFDESYAYATRNEVLNIVKSILDNQSNHQLTLF